MKQPRPWRAAADKVAPAALAVTAGAGRSFKHPAARGVGRAAAARSDQLFLVVSFLALVFTEALAVM